MLGQQVVIFAVLLFYSFYGSLLLSSLSRQRQVEEDYDLARLELIKVLAMSAKLSRTLPEGNAMK